MKNKTVDNMIKTGEVLHLYKVLSAGATLTSLLLGLILLLSPTDDTVVVIKEKNKKTYLSGRRIPLKQRMRMSKHLFTPLSRHATIGRTFIQNPL